MAGRQILPLLRRQSLKLTHETHQPQTCLATVSLCTFLPQESTHATASFHLETRDLVLKMLFLLLAQMIGKELLPPCPCA
jgi:hypothetical protein